MSDKKKPLWKNSITGSGFEDPETILANPFNFRNHPKNQKDALNGVLEEIGWIQDVIVNTTTGHLIDGHLRVELAKQKKEKVPVKYVELTEEQERIALASIDPIAALAEQDQDMLDRLIDGIDNVENQELDDFLTSLMSDTPDLDEVEAEGNTEVDDAPTAQAATTSQPGDVWIMGNHRIMCGDSCNTDHVARLMKDELADCLWIDPPYNVDYEGADGMKIQNDSMSDDNFRLFLRDLFTSCFIAMKEGAPFYIAHADSEGENFRGGAREAGLSIKQCLIWVKNALVLGRQDHQWIHEPILYGWKPGAAHKWYGDFNKTTVLDDQPDVKDMDKKQLANYIRELRNTMATSIVREDKPLRNGDHPTMKPVRLISTQLKNSTRRGDIVIDFCGGSGSTMMACETLGRHSRLMELDPVYADVIVRRYQDFTGKDAILEDTGQTFNSCEVLVVDTEEV
jgi:DNA modification methylase